MERAVNDWMGKAAVAVALTVACAGQALAQTWDAFVRVPAVAATPGHWLACPPGSMFPFASPGGSVEARCVVRKAFREETVQAPFSGPLQAVLDLYVSAPQGFKVVAVGPLPALLEKMTANFEDPTFVYIAYRFEPVR